MSISYHGNFDIAFNGLRFEPDWGDEEKRSVILDLQCLVLQGSLKGRPDTGFNQGIQGIYDQITAVGFEKRASFDFRKISLDDAKSGRDHFHRAKEIDVIRVCFHDNRGTLHI